MNETIRSKLNDFQRAAFVLGVLGLAACGLGMAWNPRQFFISYLMGYTFWLGLSLGCLGVAMIHHLTGGGWGFVTRRFLEAGFMTLPMMVLLFVPILFGLDDLYPWARLKVVPVSNTLRETTSYLNRPWFCARTIGFFTMWLVMAHYLRKWSLQQDISSEVAPSVRLRTLSGPGIVIYPLTASFALVDWAMSIEPKWYSTIFPVIVLLGQILTAFAFVTLLLAWLGEQAPFREVVTRTHFHDLGNLLLAFVVLWSYVSFSQFLIIYSGNLPREIEWYLHRTAAGWKWIIGLLALFHFFIPFFLLLFRLMKQNVARLAVIAALIFAAHIMEVFWTIEPGFFRDGLHVHWMDSAAVLGLGGVWLALFAANLKRSPLLPQNDPRIEYSILRLANAK
jgi:hypothetical protein